MKKLLILSLTLISPFPLASELNVPNQFEDGQVTSAQQMNANFEAIQAAVNDNHARIESMQQPTKAVFQAVIFVIPQNLRNRPTTLMLL